MKKYISILIVFLIVSCSNKKEHQGIWYGKYEFDETLFPVLLKFEKDYYIDYFSVPYDTLEYKIDDNIVTAYSYHPYSNDIRNEYKFQLNPYGDSLSIYYPASDIKMTLYKASESNFVIDYLGDKNLKIDLPNGSGKEMILGRDFRLHRPMFLAYENENLVANFYDTSVVVDNEYYKFLYSKRKEEAKLRYYSFPVTLIADKDIKIADLNFLKYHLKLVELNSLNYVLHTEQYDSIKFISMRIPPLPEKEYEKVEQLGKVLPPPPPPPPSLEIDFIKEHSILFEINRNSIKHLDSIISESEIKRIIQERAKLDSKFIILFYLNETAVYQDYISFIGPVFNSFYELRDKYLSEKYENLNYYSQEKRDEAKRKHPIMLRELSKEEYKKTKYNL